MWKIVLLVTLLSGCAQPFATKESQHVSNQLGVAGFCLIGYEHTYGEKPKSKNDCGNMKVEFIGVELDDLKPEGVILKWEKDI